MQDLPDTPDERIQRRRIRRWKRRARVVGPFLGVPLLLLTLSLSVDLIEYQPQPEPDRLADRPIRMSESPQANTVWPDRLSASELNAPLRNAPDDLNQNATAEDDSDPLDVMLPPSDAPRIPTPPYALNRH